MKTITVTALSVFALLVGACAETPSSTDGPDGGSGADTTDAEGSDIDSQTDGAVDDDGGGVADGDGGASLDAETGLTGCEALTCDDDELCTDEDGQAACVPRCTPPAVWNAIEAQCETPADCTTCVDQSRVCDETTGTGVCGDCLATHFEEAGLCLPLGNCDAGAADSKLQGCADLNRTCVPPENGQPASCGTCSPGFVESAGQDACTPALACGDDGACGDGKLCLQVGPGATAACLDVPCADGEAWDRTLEVCKTCGTCSGVGATGAPWPVTDQSGNCICETEQGYFWDSAVTSTQAVECDKDADGWTNEKVAQLLSQVSKDAGAANDDLGLLQNIRCNIAQIDGVVLVNEQGQTKTLTLLDLGSDADAVPLFETSRNDRGDATDPMPAHGRVFLPQEANSLTKVCAEQVDLNDNGVSDPLEDQAYEGGAAYQEVFNKLGYFTELYEGSLVDGKWHIVERSRCQDGFALSYGEGADPYWRSCHRRRDAGYPSGGSKLGYDFAGLECDAQSGACSLEPTITAPTTGVVPPAHGVCDDIGLSPGAPWRGMTHYSQFACASVRNAQTLFAGEVGLEEIGPGGDWVANTCALGEEAGTVDCSPITTTAGASAAVDTFVWAAKNFETYATPQNYEGGCIDEAAEWPHLCPGFGNTEPMLTAQSAPDGFGLLQCGCDTGYAYVNATCIEIDECANPALNDCAPDAVCANTPGAFTCTCNDGYEGDGKSCADIDECALGIDNCYVSINVEAICTNTPGGFTCACPANFPGDGVTCDDVPVNGLVAHYKLDGEPNSTTVEDSSGNNNDADILTTYGGAFTAGLGLDLVPDRFGTTDAAWKVLQQHQKAVHIDLPATFSLVFWGKSGGPEFWFALSGTNLSGVFTGVGTTSSCDFYYRTEFSFVEPSVTTLCLNTPLPNSGWTLFIMTYNDAAQTTGLHQVGPQGVFSDVVNTGNVVPKDAVIGSSLSNPTLDDIRIYDRILNETEMQQLYFEAGFQ